MNHINIFRYIAILVLLVSMYNAEAQTSNAINEPKTNDYIKKSFNISGSICLGQEIGFNGSLEYENQQWGKFILRPQLSYINSELNSFNGKFMDLGLGYGFPAFHKNRNYLYVNIYATYFVIAKEYFNVHGPSFIIELEYKLKLKHNYLIIAPYIRAASINNSKMSSKNKSDLFFGGRIGIAHNFELKD